MRSGSHTIVSAALHLGLSRLFVELLVKTGFIAAERRGRLFDLGSLDGVTVSTLRPFASNRELIRAGETISVPVKVRTVRADGSLAPTDQVDHFQIVQGQQLMEDLRSRYPDDARVGRGSEIISRSPYPYREPQNAIRRNASYIIYQPPAPEERPANWVEPFFVGLFRDGLLEGGRHGSAAVRTRCRSRLKELGLGLHTPVPDDLLVASTITRPVGRLLRELPQDGRVIIPLVQFYHAMSLARIGVRLSLRWGPRISEILQIRYDEECLPEHSRTDIEGVHYMNLVPKGKLTNARFGIDTKTRTAVKELKNYMVRRWHNGTAETQLPSVPFACRDRLAPIPAAPYVFATRHRGLKQTELSHFMRVLLCGVTDIRVHAGRSAYATILADQGADYEVIGDQLHHRPKSEMPKLYDIRYRSRASSHASMLNSEIDARLTGRVLDS